MKIQKTNKTSNTWTNLIKKFNTLATLKKQGKAYDKQEYAETLQELATAVAYSVLKKCIDVSADETLKALRRDIAKDINDLNNINRLNNEIHKDYKTDKQGNIKEEYSNDNKAKVQALDTLISDNLGDGLDLVQLAIESLLNEINKNTSVDVDIEQMYTKAVPLKKVVHSQDVQYKDVETSPIKEVYRAVRNYIYHHSNAYCDNGYTYISLSELIDNENDKALDGVYYRLKKYTDIGSKQVSVASVENLAINDVDIDNINLYAQSGFYTVDFESVNRVDSIIKALNLTDIQMQVLQLAMSNYTQSDIARYIGCSENTVKSAFRCIRTKAEKIGFTPKRE